MGKDTHSRYQSVVVLSVKADSDEMALAEVIGRMEAAFGHGNWRFLSMDGVQVGRPVYSGEYVADM